MSRSMDGRRRWRTNQICLFARLNSAENIWITLKEETTHEAPRTETTLIKRPWNNDEIMTIPYNLRSYFEILPKKYFACIEENGAKLPIRIQLYLYRIE